MPITLPDPLSDEIIVQYLAGTLDAETAAAVRAALAESPARQGVVAGVQAALAGDDIPGTFTQAEAARAQLFARVRAEQGDAALQSLPRDTRRSGSFRTSRRGSAPRWYGVRRGVWTGIAVCAVFVASVFGIRSSTHATGSSARTYAALVGQRLVITLPDQSRITLAPQSQLRVVAGFGLRTREVLLTGEAYFDVATASGAPFLVRTGRVSTRVLGTRFDVRHYPGDSGVRIAVIAGKVVAQSRRNTTLMSGMVAQVTDSVVTTTNVSDPATYAVWTQGRLVFTETPVPTMLATLGRWYGYELRLADSALAHERVTATFRAGQLRETMAALQDVLNVTMTVDGAVIMLHSRRDVPRHVAPRSTETETLHTPTEIGK